MPPLTQRKRLTNEEKLNIIEDTKKPGFCRKKTQVTFSESWGHIRNYSCLLLSKYVRSSSPSFSRNSGSLVIVDIFQLTEQSTITRVHCSILDFPIHSVLLLSLDAVMTAEHLGPTLTSLISMFIG